MYELVNPHVAKRCSARYQHPCVSCYLLRIIEIPYRIAVPASLSRHRPPQYKQSPIPQILGSLRDGGRRLPPGDMSGLPWMLVDAAHKALPASSPEMVHTHTYKHDLLQPETTSPRPIRWLRLRNTCLGCCALKVRSGNSSNEPDSVSTRICAHIIIRRPLKHALTRHYYLIDPNEPCIRRPPRFIPRTHPKTPSELYI